MPITDWDDAYANRDHVPEAEALIAAWPEDARIFRQDLAARNRGRLDIPYGTGIRQTFDLFLPKGAPKGLVVFVHGGYWIAFDKSTWSHFAAGPIAAGWAVAMPTYPLAPEARLPEITTAVGRAIGAASSLVAGPIRLAGHSAGGHLVARMMTDAAPLDPSVQGRIDRVVPISGLFDLRAMLRLKMNADWQFDLATACAESPVMQMPRSDIPVHAIVGGAERPEFLRHTALLANAWSGCGADIRATELAGLNHFTVIEGLKDPESILSRAILDD